DLVQLFRLPHFLGRTQVTQVDGVERTAEDAYAAAQTRTRDAGSVPDLARAAHEILVGRELAQAHRPARVQPVRADPHLGAEAELVPVGEARGGIDEYGGRVDAPEEALGGAVVLRDDGLGELRAVGVDEGERLVEGADDADAQDEIEV